MSQTNPKQIENSKCFDATKSVFIPFGYRKQKSNEDWVFWSFLFQHCHAILIITAYFLGFVNFFVATSNRLYHDFTSDFAVNLLELNLSKPEELRLFLFKESR
jgi:hypothetical protein